MCDIVTMERREPIIPLQDLPSIREVQTTALLQEEIRRLKSLADARLSDLEFSRQLSRKNIDNLAEANRAKSVRIDELNQQLGARDEIIRRQGIEIDRLKAKLTAMAE